MFESHKILTLVFHFCHLCALAQNILAALVDRFSNISWSRGYKTFFMLNSAEHEIFSANRYENPNKSWHFHIY